MTFPTVEISADERARREATKATLDEAELLFRKWGTVRMLGLFDSGFMAALATHYKSRYAAKLVDTDKPDRRPLFTPQLTGPFADAAYHSNPILFPLVQRLLGDDCVLGAFGSVVSFPGAPAQFIHRDSASLYDDYAIDVRLPPYALTVLIPLVDADQEVGATRVWPGSHHEPSFEKAEAMPSESPDLFVGSVLVTDSRTLHGGSPNRSQRVRPIVYNAYHRSWYRDDGGYAERPAVFIDAIDQLLMPADRQALFRIPRESSAVDRMRWELKRLTGHVRANGRIRALKRTIMGGHSS